MSFFLWARTEQGQYQQKGEERKKGLISSRVGVKGVIFKAGFRLS